MNNRHMPGPIAIHQLTKMFRPRRSLGQFLTRSRPRSPETWALKGVTLDVPTGSIFGLLGPNGAGKTTLLKILSGLILPTQGTARVGGFDVAHQDGQIQRILGFVSSDERSFYWRLTGRENLRFFGSLYSLHGKALSERLDYLLERLELKEQADKPFGEYSSGMKQRLAMVRALLHDPPILLLDEPTRSLDPISAKHLRRFIAEELNGREGKTLLLATHNLQEAEQLCQRVAVLSSGRILGEGSVEELPEWGKGKEAYVLILSGLSRMPDTAQDGLSWTTLSGNRIRAAGEFERDGERLSRLLEEVFRQGGKVLSCSKVEPTLQEVFDRIERENS
jgi:ABC-2 type transport system ATP-binding protein